MDARRERRKHERLPSFLDDEVSRQDVSEHRSKKKFRQVNKYSLDKWSLK